MHEKKQKNKNLALFDFDGTLCSKDSFTGFIFYTRSKRHILRQGFKILPWIQAYYLKLYPAHAMRPKLYSAMFQAADAADIQQLAQEYAQTLPKYFSPAIYQQLKLHQALGDDVVLVSASLDLYLLPICKALNIQLICTETAIQDQRLTGLYHSADCSREQKAARVSAAYDLAQYAAVYAYGNSDEDLAMLALADYPYMVGQDKELPALLQINSTIKMA